MKISSTVDLDRGYIHYSYDTVTDEHYVSIWEVGISADILKPNRSKGSAGHVINDLVPYRHITEIKELIAWLAS
jgi:hypothetical protein